MRGSTDPDFPIYPWDELLPQAELTLNVRRASRLNPHNLAWTMLHSVYDYNQTPIGPAGCKVIVFESAQQ
jgi:hypothetical protein